MGRPCSPLAPKPPMPNTDAVHLASLDHVIYCFDVLSGHYGGKSIEKNFNPFSRSVTNAHAKDQAIFRNSSEAKLNCHALLLHVSRIDPGVIAQALSLSSSRSCANFFGLSGMAPGTLTHWSRPLFYFAVPYLSHGTRSTGRGTHD